MADPKTPFTNEPAPSGGYANIGAYGNTAQASLSPVEYLLVTHPHPGGRVTQGSTYTIEWRSSGFTGDVLIEYSTTGPSGPFTTLVADEANNGAYNWVVDPSLYPASDQYVIRMTSINSPAVSVTDAPFKVGPPIHYYYVNDGSTTATSTP